MTAPFVALYLLKARRRRQRVSTLWLWQGAIHDVEARAPWRRLTLNALFLLQLFVLVLMVLAAAGPSRSSRLVLGDKAAFVIDSSASLGAADRAAQVRDTVRRLVAATAVDTQLLMVRGGVLPRVMAPLAADRQALNRAVDTWSPSPAPTDLGLAVEIARSILGAEGRVLVVTDHMPSATRLEGWGLSEDDVVQVGEEVTNAGIVSLGVRAADASGRRHEAFVKVQAAAAERAPVRGKLLLRVDGQLMDARAVELDASGVATRTLELAGVDAGVIEVEWQGEETDSLAADDRAWWVLRPPQSRQYRLRGAVDPSLRRVLAFLPDWQEVESATGAVDLEVLAQVEPEPGGGSAPFLWIDPPTLSPAAPAVVLTWDRSHAALRFAEIGSMRLLAGAFERPSGARILAESSAGPLILEGVWRTPGEAGRRYLAWAFDPARSDLPRRAAFPILVRNALEFLAPPGGGLPGAVASGKEVSLPWSLSDSVVLFSPSGRRLKSQVSGADLHLPAFEELGVYRLVAAGREWRFGVSLTDEGETTLSRRDRGSVSVADTPERSTVGAAPQVGKLYGTTTQQPLWPWMAALALGLLMVEGALFHHRPR